MYILLLHISRTRIVDRVSIAQHRNEKVRAKGIGQCEVNSSSMPTEPLSIQYIVFTSTQPAPDRNQNFRVRRETIIGNCENVVDTHQTDTRPLINKSVHCIIYTKN